MDKHRMAACGIDCNSCGTYNKTHDLKAAEGLVEWYREMGWIGADEGAEAVQKNPPFCNGCWGDSAFCGCGSVDFRICCVEKGIAHCGECDDFPCKPYREWAGWHESHQKAMEHLLALSSKSTPIENG